MAERLACIEQLRYSEAIRGGFYTVKRMQTEFFVFLQSF